MLDVFLILIAFSLVFLVYSVTGQSVENGLLFILAAVVVNIFFLWVNGVYGRIWVRTSGSSIHLVLLAPIEATLALVLLDWQISSLSVPAILIGQILCTAAFVCLRFRSRVVHAISKLLS